MVPLGRHVNLFWKFTAYFIRGHHNKDAIFTQVIINLSVRKRGGKCEGSYYRAEAITLANKVTGEFRPEDFPHYLCNASKNFCFGWVASFGKASDPDLKALDDANPTVSLGNCFNV